MSWRPKFEGQLSDRSRLRLQPRLNDVDHPNAFQLPKGELRNSMLYPRRTQHVSLPTSFSFSFSVSTNACMHAYIRSKVKLRWHFGRLSPYRTGYSIAAFFVFSSSSRRIGAAQGAAHDRKSDRKWYLLLACNIRICRTDRGILVTRPWPKFCDKKKIGSPEFEIKINKNLNLS